MTSLFVLFFVRVVDWAETDDLSLPLLGPCFMQERHGPWQLYHTPNRRGHFDLEWPRGLRRRA
jgi:hypothetical protein